MYLAAQKFGDIVNVGCLAGRCEDEWFGTAKFGELGGEFGKAVFSKEDSLVTFIVLVRSHFWGELESA